jgi:hypothetical protein
MDVQRSCLVAAFMISYTLERAAAAAELAPREPGPGETNLIFVSREPGQLSCVRLHLGSMAQPMVQASKQSEAASREPGSSKQTGYNRTA